MTVADFRVLVGALADLDHHETGRGHPERPARLAAAVRGVFDAGLGDAVVPLQPRPATHTELARVHSDLYLDAMAHFSEAGGGHLDPDTVASRGSWVTAMWAAGTGLAAIEALDRREAEAAFVAVRPPGHHATREQAMGFCLVNNVAVAAAALADRGERVLVLDWDVHHGNGTQDIFWNDRRVMYVSIHEWPAYPGTGRASDVGGPGAPGLTVNVPLPAGATGDAALAAIDEVVAPAVDAFGPTWVLVSAGFDAHRDDPLADLMWTAGDFALLSRRVAAMVPEPGRTVLFLEGGYDLEALRRSVGATVAALAGEEWVEEPPSSGGPGRDAVEAAKVTRERRREAEGWAEGAGGRP